MMHAQVASVDERRTWLGGERPRVLIGILYAGEQEYSACIESVRSQDYPDLQHIIFENLPNEEAHQRLYGEFMRRSREFDLFVKLDGDMVFKRHDSVARIADIFRTHHQVDHALLAVHDGFSNGLIMGLHAFSRRCVWVPDGDTLFVDPRPDYPGKQVTLWGPPAPLVDHAPDPSPWQSFRFGVHRGAKALQTGRRFLYWRAVGQWELLGRVWREFRENRRLPSGYAILGADLVLSGMLPGEAYHSDILEASFSRYAGASWEDIARYLEPRWNSRVRREIWYRRRAGFGRYYLGALRWATRRLTHFFESRRSRASTSQGQ